MGIGHIAVGLGLKRADRQLNVGWLMFAALLPDFLLGWFVLAGWESYQAPPDYGLKHYLMFTFPWSHGLLATLGWSTLARYITRLITKRRWSAFVVGLAVVSHFLLDGIVHLKGLPLAFADSPAFGLGLWRNLPVELLLEAAMTIGGLAIYMTVLPSTRPRARFGMAAYILIIGTVMVSGQAMGAVAPPFRVLFMSWVLAPVVIAGIAMTLDQRSSTAETLSGIADSESSTITLD